MRLEDIYALLKKIEAGQVSPSEIQEIKEKLQNKTEKNLLTYVDGKICTYGGEDVTFQEVYNMLLTEPDFVVLVYNDRAYHPNQVDADTIIFASTYTNAGHIVTYRILFNSDESVTVSEVTAEKLADKVTEITDSNKEDTTKYASVKAVSGYANSKSEITSLLNGKLDKSGGTITGDLSVNGNLAVGGVTLQYDNVDNCLKFNFANNSLSTLSLEDEVIE